jgi:hypothetical protein
MRAERKGSEERKENKSREGNLVFGPVCRSFLLLPRQGCREDKRNELSLNELSLSKLSLNKLSLKKLSLNAKIVRKNINGL